MHLIHMRQLRQLVMRVVLSEDAGSFFMAGYFCYVEALIYVVLMLGRDFNYSGSWYGLGLIRLEIWFSWRNIILGSWMGLWESCGVPFKENYW